MDERERNNRYNCILEIRKNERKKKEPQEQKAGLPIVGHGQEVSCGWRALCNCGDIGFKMTLDFLEHFLNPGMDGLPLIPSRHKLQEIICVVIPKFGERVNTAFGNVEHHVGGQEKYTHTKSGNKTLGEGG